MSYRLCTVCFSRITQASLRIVSTFTMYTCYVCYMYIVYTYYTIHEHTHSIHTLHSITLYTVTRSNIWHVDTFISELSRQFCWLFRRLQLVILLAFTSPGYPENLWNRSHRTRGGRSDLRIFGETTEPLALIGQAGGDSNGTGQGYRKTTSELFKIKKSQDILTQRRTLLAVVTLGCFEVMIHSSILWCLFCFDASRISLDSWITGKARQRLLCFHSRIARKGASKKLQSVLSDQWMT